MWIHVYHNLSKNYLPNRTNEIFDVDDRKNKNEKEKKVKSCITRLLFLEKWETNVSSSISHHSYHLEINLFHQSVGFVWFYDYFQCIENSMTSQ